MVMRQEFRENCTFTVTHNGRPDWAGALRTGSMARPTIVREGAS